MADYTNKTAKINITKLQFVHIVKNAEKSLKGDITQHHVDICTEINCADL